MGKTPLSQKYDELLWRWFNQMRRSTSTKSAKLADISQESFLKLYDILKKKGDQLSVDAEAVYEKTLAFGRQSRDVAKITIEIESSEIQLSKSRSQMRPIYGKAIFKSQGIEIKVDCIVACGHWDRLGELKYQKINVIDYLPELLPPPQPGYGKPPLGLITFQNGIKNNVEEFRKMGAAIINQFPEGPLCIGLYNPTTRFVFTDIHRFSDEPRLNPAGIYGFFKLLKTLAELIPSINPNMVWTHFAHSEAGLIAHVGLDLCKEARQPKITEFLKKHLIIATYGAVKPIPYDVVREAINTYSNKDIVLLLAQQYIDQKVDKIIEDKYLSDKVHRGKRYQVFVVPSKTPWKFNKELLAELRKDLSFKKLVEMSWLERLAHVKEFEDLSARSERLYTKAVDLAYGVEDHAFLGDTYKAVLKANTDELKEKYQVSHAKNSW